MMGRLSRTYSAWQRALVHLTSNLVIHLHAKDDGKLSHSGIIARNYVALEIRRGVSNVYGIAQIHLMLQPLVLLTVIPLFSFHPHFGCATLSHVTPNGYQHLGYPAQVRMDVLHEDIKVEMYLVYYLTEQSFLTMSVRNYIWLSLSQNRIAPLMRVQDFGCLQVGRHAIIHVVVDIRQEQSNVLHSTKPINMFCQIHLALFRFLLTQPLNSVILRRVQDQYPFGR